MKPEHKKTEPFITASDSILKVSLNSKVVAGQLASQTQRTKKWMFNLVAAMLFR